HMAGDPSILTPRAALVRFLAERVPDQGRRLLAGKLVLAVIAAPSTASSSMELMKQLGGQDAEDAVLLALRHRPLQILLASVRILSDLEAKGVCEALSSWLPFDLITEAGAAVAARPDIAARLLASFEHRPQAMAASILHATGSGWAPEPGSAPCLKGAYLSHANWPGICLA